MVAQGWRGAAQGGAGGGAGLHGRHGHLRVLCCGHGAAIRSAPLSAALQLSYSYPISYPPLSLAKQLDSAIFRYIPGHATIRRAGFKVVSGEAEAAVLAAELSWMLAWRAALPGEVYVKADDTKRSFMDYF